MIGREDEGHMPRLDYSIDIKAPREKVFQYVSNVEFQPEWVKWAKQAEVTSTNVKGIGTTDAMLMQVGPRKEQVEAIVTEYKDGQLYTRRHTKGMEMTERYSLVNVGDNTKVAWSVDYVPPMGAMGKLFDFLFVMRLFEQLMQDSLSNLREKLETAR
jgi:uncharacterized membrane protein